MDYQKFTEKSLSALSEAENIVRENGNAELGSEHLLFALLSDETGLIPEIIGRLPVITNLDHLDREALKRILTEPKNALMRQYEKMFELDGIKLTVEPEVLDLIVDTSIENKLGARGLRSICERIMTDAMYDAPSTDDSEFVVTVEYAKSKL